MGNILQFRRGVDAERGTVVLDSGEPGWTTDTKELYVGDGVTYGGVLVTGSGGGGSGTLCELSDVNCAGTVNGKTLTYQSGTWVPETPAGGGDMLISQYVTGAGTVYNASRLAGEVIGTVQVHTVDAANISGTIGDANIPDVETLSYAVPFADAQIPTLDATKIISGTFDSAQIPSLPTARITAGTFVADRIPTMENLKGTVPDGKIPDVDSLSYGAAFATAQIPSIGAYKTTTGTFNSNQIPSLPTARINTGTFNLNRIPTMDDVHIPNVEGLSYGAAFAVAQIPNLAATKITTGTFNASHIPVLPTSRITTGTFGLARIPAVDDVRIPDLDTLSYGAAFAVGQIPNLAASKITTGTFALARIPAVDDARIPDLDTLSYSGAFAVAQIPNLAASKITTGSFNVDRIPVLPTSRYGSAVLVNGARKMEGTLNIGSHRISQVDKIMFTNDVMLETTGNNIYVRNKADTGWSDIYPGLLVAQIGIKTYGTLDMFAHPLANVPSPTGSNFAANKSYVDNHVWAADDITSGTIGLARIPTIDDARIPNLDTLSYGAAFATAQIPGVGAYKITAGTLAVARHEILDNLNGTVALAQVPTMDDGHIPNVEGLSYGAAFATAQIPGVGAYKITAGTLAVARHEILDNLNGTVALAQVPTMDDGHIPDLETLSYGAAFATAQIPNLTAAKITVGTFDDARIPDVGVVAINFVLDGGGAAITAGTVGFLEVPFACHVDRWTLLADQHGSVVIDIWRDSYGNFPPTDADSMSGTTNMPAISGTVAAQGTDLSGWGTQGISSGDILAYHVDSCASIELCTISLKATKT